MKFARAAVLGWLALALSSGCSKKNERLHVATTIYPIFDLARTVAGPDADVELLVPVGTTEHRYTPTAKDKDIVSRSALGIMVGVGLDTWMDSLVRENGPPKARILKVGDRVPTRSFAEGTEEDPHVWLDPERARLIVRAIAEEMGRVDGSHAIAYRERATKLDATLEALDHELESRMAKLTKRRIVTHHASFGYFAERYKLDVVGVVIETPGTSSAPHDHADADHMAMLAKERKLLAVSVEPQLSANFPTELSKRSGMPIIPLDPLGGSSDTDTYAKLLQKNATALEQSLK